MKQFLTPTTRQFTAGARLRHYKGGLYEVVGNCLIEATLKPGVLYRALQGENQDIVWMRPMAEFQDSVATAVGIVPRFVLISEAAACQ